MLGEQHKPPGSAGEAASVLPHPGKQEGKGNLLSHAAAIANTGSNELLPQTQQEREEKMSKDNFMEVN